MKDKQLGSYRHQPGLCTMCTVVLLLISSLTQAQDSLTFSGLRKSSLALLLDDTYLVVGVNRATLHYSNHFREVGGQGGVTMGIEQYFPTEGKFFVSSGLHFSQRNFTHRVSGNVVMFRNWYMHVPIQVAYELPTLRAWDLRLLLGADVGIRLHSRQQQSYGLAHLGNPDLFRYSVRDFQRVDMGWFFGLSVEHRNFLVRSKVYSGFVKIDRKDQGMLNVFSLEVGYFAFRAW